jgi:uncharacterized CHY-type Zn-finger protein
MGLPDLVCGACGAALVLREVAPCLDCGGAEDEIEELRIGYHKYAHFRLFDDEVLCDFCDADMPSTDPCFWGFPRGFDWGSALEGENYEYFAAPTQGRRQLACSKCHNTLRKQEFVRRNAQRNRVQLAKEYWPHLNTGTT